MRRLPTLLLLAAAAMPWHAARADEARYRYDPVHSQILFGVSHDGFSRSFGRLHIARGWLRFDPDDFSHASTALDIDMAGLDMGDPAWSKAVRAAGYLDAAGHPYAHFASTSVERLDAHHGVLHGTLTLRGVSRPLDIPFTFNRQAHTVFGMHTVAGFSATATLDRAAFGIDRHLGSIGRQVQVWLQIEAIREDARKEPTDAATH